MLRKVTVLALGIVVGMAAIVRLAPDPEPPDTPSCLEGPTIAGIDVSYHQDRIRWPLVAKAGIEFAFIRVSDGLYVRDPEFRTNWQGAKKVRIARGAYQFFRPEQNAIAQADALIAAIERDPGELPPVIDVEVTGGLTPGDLSRQISVWVGRVRTKLGVEPIIYASPDFWKDALGNADVGVPQLWLAHYTEACPRVPAPWKSWTFWQYSKTGRVPGIKGDVDLNVARAPR